MVETINDLKEHLKAISNSQETISKSQETQSEKIEQIQKIIRSSIPLYRINKSLQNRMRPRASFQA